MQQASVNPCLCQRLLDTLSQVLVSLLWSHYSFLLGPGAHKLLFAPSKSLFPQSCVMSVTESHWPPKLNSLWFYSPFARSPDWEICCGSYNFLNSVRIFWYNCSADCGSSAWQFYGGVNGTLLQEGLCHPLDDPGLQHPESLPLWQATADPCLSRRYSNTQRQVWLSLCGASGSWCAQGFV